MILIYYAGGTIGMQESPQGRLLGPKSGARFQTLVESLLQKRGTDVPSFKVHEGDHLFDSSDASPADWYDIGLEIQKASKNFDGFVVLHGSDSLAWCASALAFQLQGLGKAVVVTGAQAPLSTPGKQGEDALDNIVGSLRFAANPALKEVGLYFGGSLLRGCRARKWYAQAAVGFESPNYPVLGRGSASDDTHHLEPASIAAMSSNPRLLAGKAPTTSRVARIGIWPGILPDLVRGWLVHEAVDAVVLESLGSGSLPDDVELLRTLRDASDAGKIVTMVSQCPYGTIEPGLYASRRVFADAGVVSGGDMTVEAAMCKLNYLLATQMNVSEMRKAFSENLVGELSFRGP